MPTCEIPKFSSILGIEAKLLVLPSWIINVMCGSSKSFGSWICTVDTAVFLEVHWLSRLPRGHQGKKGKTLGFHCLPRFGLLRQSLVGMWHSKNEVFVCRPTVNQYRWRSEVKGQKSVLFLHVGSRIKLRPSGLVASASICWTISPTPYSLLVKDFYPPPSCNSLFLLHYLQNYKGLWA